MAKMLKDLEKNIETSYQNELYLYKDRKINRGVKAIDVCAILMARRLLKDKKIWWYSWENIGIHDEFFGSHKMPARMSELYTNYPEYFEGRKIGRYKVCRILFERLDNEVLLNMCKSSFKVKNLYKDDN